MVEKKKLFLSSLFGLQPVDTYSAVVEAVWTLEPGEMCQQLFSRGRGVLGAIHQVSHRALKL